MKDNRRRIESINIIAKWISFVAQSYILLAVPITSLMLIDRFVLCLYYRLPMIFNSLGIARYMPMISLSFIIISFIIRAGYEFVSSFIEFKKSMNKGRSSNNYKEILKLSNKCFFGGLMPEWILKIFILPEKRYLRIIHSKKPKKTKLTKEEINISDSLTSLRQSIGMEIAFVLAWEVAVLNHNASWKLPLGLFLVSSILAEIVFIILNFTVILNKISKQVLYEDKEAIESDEKLTIKNMESHKFKLQIMEFCFLVIFAVSSWVIAARTINLTEKKDFGVIKVDSSVGVQDCAIVLDLDEFFVVQPIEEINNNLVIRTEQYIFKEKNNTVVTRKRYNEVSLE